MSLAELLPLPVVLPGLGAVLAPLLARLHRRLPLAVGMLALLGSLGVLIAEATRVCGGNGRIVTHFFSNERPVHGHSLGIAFAADPFGVTFALLTAAVGTLLLLFALSELGDLGARELGGLACLVLLLLAALIGAALTADSVNLFVWFEVAAIASYGLTGFFLERPIALEAAFKNCVLTGMAGFAVFIGAGMLYSSTGALNLGQLHHALSATPNRAELLALALLVGGFATKAGLIPFHGWLPDTQTPVPTAIAALFSALMDCLGVIALVRISLLVVPRLTALLHLLTVLGIASAVIGAVLALVQDDLKRLLAWDTVSQMGILVAGFASRNSKGVAGAIFHLVNHGLFKALLFLCAGAVIHATGLTKLSEMGGLARRRPLLTGAFTIGCLAIAGVPPLDGYASLGLIHEGLQDDPAAFAFALLAQVITVAALARAAYLGFYRRRPGEYEHLDPTRAGMRVSLLTLAAGCIASGVLAPEFVHEVAGPAASGLLHPGLYGSAALSNGVRLPKLSVDFSYDKIETLLTAFIEVLLGLLLCAAALRLRRTPAPVRWLRGLHTGSVNDYAAFATVGMIATAYVLMGLA